MWDQNLFGSLAQPTANDMPQVQVSPKMSEFYRRTWNKSSSSPPRSGFPIVPCYQDVSRENIVIAILGGIAKLRVMKWNWTRPCQIARSTPHVAFPSFRWWKKRKVIVLPLFDELRLPKKKEAETSMIKVNTTAQFSNELQQQLDIPTILEQNPGCPIDP